MSNTLCLIRRDGRLVPGVAARRSAGDSRARTVSEAGPADRLPRATAEVLRSAAPRALPTPHLYLRTLPPTPLFHCRLGLS